MMEYSIRYRLDVKNNAYVSKKNGSTEPYYQISAIIRINGTREIHYSLGYSAQKSAWFSKAEDALKGDGNRTCGIHKNHTAKKKTRLIQYSDVNRAIDLVSAKLLSLSNKVEDISRDDLIRALDEEVGKSPRRNKTEVQEPENTIIEENSLWVFADLYCQDKLVTEGRNKTRRNAMNHFKNFESTRGTEFTFADCNAKLMMDFQSYLNEDDNKEGKYNHIKSGVHRPRKKNHNSISKILESVKHFFKWCRIRYEVTEYGNISDYKVPTTKYGDPIILSQEEKRQLYAYQFEDKELELYRDLFYFQCSVGCRISDFFGLKYGNLRLDGNVWSIHYLPRKTKGVTAIEARVPFSGNALAIFEKYKIEGADPKTPLFPFPKNPQTLNKNLKKIFQKAGLDRTVKIYNAYGEEEYVPFYSLAKSKFARSCFIDILVGQGESYSTISTMSGHKPNSAAFHRYHNSQKIEQQNQAIRYID